MSNWTRNIQSEAESGVHSPTPAESGDRWLHNEQGRDIYEINAGHESSVDLI